MGFKLSDHKRRLIDFAKVQFAVPACHHFERKNMFAEQIKPTLIHSQVIQKYIEAIAGADDLHILVVVGSPGWGKSTAVQEALLNAGVRSVQLGSYSTALHLFNVLAEHPSEFVLIDDCAAGLFGDSCAMAILKAATWPSDENRRVIKWGSTSNKVVATEFEFRGRLIVVCNSFPTTPDGKAILSRGFFRQIDVSLNEAKQLLQQAASDTCWFERTELAQEVAEFLIERLNEAVLPDLSFRILKLGYRLAETHPEIWRELFAGTLPRSAVNAEILVQELADRGLMVKEQPRLFCEATGLKTRSFFNYRKSARVSRTKQSADAAFDRD